jgi:N-acetylneuraminic acid mutarotase
MRIIILIVLATQYFKILFCLQSSLAELKLPLRLKWRRGKDMPLEVFGYPTVVMLKEKVYIGGGSMSLYNDRAGGKLVMVYEPKQDSWDSLPQYTYEYFSMAVVDDQLVLVGGCDIEMFESKTNKLGVWNEQSKRWTHSLPPMTTARQSSSVATHNNRWLVVMGGYGDSGKYLSRVEILDTAEPVQWYQAESLPQPCHQISSATIGNMCYLLGGYTTMGASKKVFSVYLDDLISQAAPNFIPTAVFSPWQSLPVTPKERSTALAFNGALLAIGGDDSGSSAIHMYQPSSNSWVKAGELPTKRHTSGCIVLPTGELFIAGGGVGETRQMIEIASIKFVNTI